MGLVLLLLHSGMDITQQALQSALTSAAGSGRLEVVRLLLQYGADINDFASAWPGRPGLAWPCQCLQ
jgi:ankyrin repeat protein